MFWFTTFCFSNLLRVSSNGGTPKWLFHNRQSDPLGAYFRNQIALLNGMFYYKPSIFGSAHRNPPSWFTTFVSNDIHPSCCCSTALNNLALAASWLSGPRQDRPWGLSEPMGRPSEPQRDLWGFPKNGGTPSYHLF